jgi:putative restriction endonuclease
MFTGFLISATSQSAEMGDLKLARRRKEDFENGRLYYEMQGRPVTLPRDVNQRPARDALEWHQANGFLG